MKPLFLGPCHNGMACPRVAVGRGGLQMWRVAAIILNMQLRTADKAWFPSLFVEQGLTACHGMLHRASDLN